MRAPSCFTWLAGAGGWWTLEDTAIHIRPLFSPDKRPFGSSGRELSLGAGYRASSGQTTFAGRRRHDPFWKKILNFPDGAVIRAACPA
jgi:hypothetical protein